MSQRKHTNYYEILEVSPEAASTEIHKAYQRARQTYSQDNPALYSMFSPDEARELMRLIDEAYNVLGNQATRKTYDASLGSGTGSSSPMLHAVVTALDAPSDAASPTLHASPATQASSTSTFQPEASDAFALKRRELQKAAIPTGQGRTSLSTFKLDDSFEAEIKSATEFDGGFIQRVRLYKNVSIDKMSDATRISRPYLMALETNDYKSLPAAVFVRGFVVQVARQLALEDTKVAASYMKLFKAGGGK